MSNAKPPTEKATELEAAAVWMDIAQLKAWENNPRKNDAAVDGVAKSIQKFGFGAPILARKHNLEVIAGHTRLKAAAKLGLHKVPVRILDLDADQAHLLALADNRLGENAEWDDELLSAILGDLKQKGEDLELSGFDSDELDKLLGDDVPDGDDDVAPVDQAAELQKKWGTELGQLWQIGPHRLLCGDSTKPEDVARLFGEGPKAKAMWTDPPYGVSYVGKTKAALTIQNDSLDEGDLLSFLTDCFTAAGVGLLPGSAFYIAHLPGPLSLQFGLAIDAVGWKFRQGLVWVKDSMVLGRSDYHYKHEPIAFGYVPAPSGRLGRGSDNWHGNDSQVSVFEVARPKASEMHPTMKPVDLVIAMLRNSSAKGDVVYEPFSGSGTTMLACQHIGRICNSIELDPKFVAVALERMSALGCEPKLVCNKAA